MRLDRITPDVHAQKNADGSSVVRRMRARDQVPLDADLVVMISLNATMKRVISSGVPIETRSDSLSGGNGRPTIKPFFRNSAMIGTTGFFRCTMKKLVSEGMVS